VAEIGRKLWSRNPGTHSERKAPPEGWHDGLRIAGMPSRTSQHCLPTSSCTTPSTSGPCAGDSAGHGSHMGPHPTCAPPLRGGLDHLGAGTHGDHWVEEAEFTRRQQGAAQCPYRLQTVRGSSAGQGAQTLAGLSARGGGAIGGGFRGGAIAERPGTYRDRIGRGAFLPESDWTTRFPLVVEAVNHFKVRSCLDATTIGRLA
jgi:hypothetical protein